MKASFEHLDPFRVRQGHYGSPDGMRYGKFVILHNHFNLLCVADSGSISSWEHVSVSAHEKRNGSHRPRIPTWDQMCIIKDIFWDAEEAVIQFHPPRSEYINQCPYCLHLWKPTLIDIPRPPKILVGNDLEMAL